MLLNTYIPLIRYYIIHCLCLKHYYEKPKRYQGKNIGPKVTFAYEDDCKNACENSISYSQADVESYSRINVGISHGV